MTRSRVLVAAGLVVLAVVWLGPLPALARSAFVAHMTMHVSVVALAAPLLAVGLSGGRGDPSRAFPSLFAPVPASALELVVVWGWHAPAFHHAARSTPVVMALEQGSFLLVGILVWLSAFGGDAAGRDVRRAAGIVGLLLTSMHMTLLGALLALATHPLYHDAAPGVPVLGLGLGALEDQQLGGALMLAVGGAVYLAGGLALAASLVRDRGIRGERP